MPGLALLVALFAQAAPASAYEVRLVYAGPATVGVGEVVAIDAYLDTRGETTGRINALSVGLTFDPDLFTYVPEQSDAEDWILWTFPVPVGKATVESWLVAFADPPVVLPKPPFDQLNVAFIAYAPFDLVDGEYREDSSNVWLARFTFEATAPGTGAFDWGFDKDDTAFYVDSGTVGQDISGQVSTPGSTSIVVVGAPSVPTLAPVGALVVVAAVSGLAIRAARGRGSAARREAWPRRS